ncbi:putative septum site-determining protein MinC [Dissostichus eleginoides]|uniref:Septum site-determining protein MinC n=1 Tax=Dissostichus eleginoides TaxID=100907 RepID=A0AAD9BRX0_DISEL|nr:putative septum site-determining protein MinC [Dissostichus eleginoides]
MSQQFLARGRLVYCNCIGKEAEEQPNRTSDVDISAPEERRKKAHMAEPNRPISPRPQNHRHCRPNLRLEAWKAKQCDCIS